MARCRPIAKLNGCLVITSLRCLGELRLGPGRRLVLHEIKGEGFLQGWLRAGPLRLPLRIPFALRRRDGALAIVPRRRFNLLMLLGPLLDRRSGALMLQNGFISLDLERVTDGAIGWTAVSDEPGRR